MKEWVLTPDRFLSKEELGKLLKRAEELRALGVAKRRKQPVRDWLIIRLALLSGLRAGEVSALQVTDAFIGYSRSELVVRRGKGGKQRVVRIGNDLKRDLRWYLRWKSENGELAPDAHLLRSQRSERLSRGAVWRRWKRHCPLHRLHDARHTNATMLLEVSKDLRLVQKQLGHSRPTTTAVYAGIADERMAEAVDSMEQLARRSMRSKVGSPNGPAVTAGARTAVEESPFTPISDPDITHDA
ncbi:site-specific integrase [bacterium]|nr:site-specific integrase [bacterium]